jgi:hypothetical protein
MHLSGPATYSWVGVGTGSEMAGSVMWIVYEGANKDSQSWSFASILTSPSSPTPGLTLSPRLSDDEVEPSYSSDVDCTLLNGSIAQTNNTRYYSAEIHCKNLTALGTGDGKLDLSNKKQPFLYAWGPTDGAISSTSKTANMKRHDAYGTFFADMTQATSDSASVPSGVALTTTANAEADGDATSDGDKVGPAHAAIMLATFGLVFPLGAVLLRLLESVKIHGIVQGVGVLTAVVGVALGIYLGTMYNKVSSPSPFPPHRRLRLRFSSQKTSHPGTRSSASFSSPCCSYSGASGSTTTSVSAGRRDQLYTGRCIALRARLSCWVVSSTASWALTLAGTRIITSTGGSQLPSSWSSCLRCWDGRGG